MMLKRSAMAAADKDGGAVENPYLASRRVWNDITGAATESSRFFRVVAILCLSIALVAVAGAIHIGSQPKFVPYLVHVDQVGQSVAQGPLPAVRRNDARIVKAAVADFVSKARMVTPDVTLQKGAVMRVYALLSKNDPAAQKMTDWYRSEDPLSRAEREMVEPTIKAILQQSAQTWQVDWVETTRDRQGSPLSETSMRALVTVYQADPGPGVTEDELQHNPTGIFVRDFSWSRVL